MLKFTAQAAWTMMDARLAVSSYTSSDSPRLVSPSLATAQMTLPSVTSRGLFFRCSKLLLTRSWAAMGSLARTRQITCKTSSFARNWSRRWAPRAPVAPVRTCFHLLHFLLDRQYKQAALTTTCPPLGLLFNPWPVPSVCTTFSMSLKSLYSLTRSSISFISSSVSIVFPCRRLTKYFERLTRVSTVYKG